MHYPTNKASTHRFHEYVAVYLGGQTAYLSADLALQLAEALTLTAMDIKNCHKFTDSKVGTKELTDDE